MFNASNSQSARKIRRDKRSRIIFESESSLNTALSEHFSEDLM